MDYEKMRRRDIKAKIPSESMKEDIGARFVKKKSEWLIKMPRKVGQGSGHSIYVRRRDNKFIKVLLKECVYEEGHDRYWTFKKSRSKRPLQGP